MEVVAAGLGDHRHLPAAAASVLGRVGVGLDPELLNAFHGGDRRRAVDALNIALHHRRDAVQLNIVKRLLTAVDREADGAGEEVALRVRR